VRRFADPARGGRGKGPNRGPADRVHHTSLSLIPPPSTGQVFRPPGRGLDKSSAAVLSKEKRKRHGSPHGTTDCEESHRAGGSARGVPGALRGAEP
jgi:hypothetical protein